MWDPDRLDYPAPSFAAPIGDPGTEPDAPPFRCLHVNEQWIPILAGCAMQVAQPPSWDTDDPTLLADLLARATILINLIGQAEPCVVNEAGKVSLTITAGNGSASVVVPFVNSYTAPPNVLVSCDNVELAATWTGTTTTGFTAVLAANVPVTADTTADVTWLAAA